MSGVEQLFTESGADQILQQVVERLQQLAGSSDGRLTALLRNGGLKSIDIDRMVILRARRREPREGPGGKGYAAIEKRDNTLPPDDRMQFCGEVLPYRDSRISDFCGIGARTDAPCQNGDYRMRR